MDEHQQLDQLDQSLSEMTNLMLSGESAGELDVDGEFGAPVPGTEGPANADPTPHLDALQAGLNAALEEVAQDEAATAPQATMTRTQELRPAPDPADSETGPIEPPSVEIPPPALANPATPAPAGAPASALEPPSPSDSAAQMQSVAQDLAASAPPPETTAEEVMKSVAADLESLDPAPTATSEPGTSAAETPVSAPERSEAAAFPAVSGPEQRRIQVESTDATSGDGLTPASATPGSPPAVEPSQPRPRARKAGGVISEHLGALVALGAEPLGRYLAAQPKAIRHSLAWVALWTAFNATCVWTYILLFRSTEPNARGVIPTQVLTGDASVAEPKAPAEPAAHRASPGQSSHH